MGRTKGSKNKPKTTSKAEEKKIIKKPNKRPVDKLRDLNKKDSEITRYTNTYPKTTVQDIADAQWKQLVERNIEKNLINILFKRVRYNNLPDTIFAETIEKGFYDWNGVSIFKDEDGIWGLGAIPYGQRHPKTGKPLLCNAMGYNGFQQLIEVKYPFKTSANFTFTDILLGVMGKKKPVYGVYVEENWAELSYKDLVKQYTRQLTDKILAIEIASNKLKDPFILGTSNLAARKNAYKIEEAVINNKSNFVVIKSDNPEIGDLISVKDMFELVEFKGNPESVKTLLQVYDNIFNRFLQTVGINANPSPDKTQYVSEIENSSNNGIIDIEQDIWFDTRKELCDNANKILGLNISVEKNIDEMATLVKNNMASDYMGKENENERPTEN